MKVKKRTKNSRIRGARTCGWGFRQSHKGHGAGGGFGMAGTGKRGDQIKQKALMMANAAGFKTYFGKQGMTSAKSEKKRTEQINLKDLKANFFKKDGDKLDFSKHKILGTGEGFKAEVKALAASKTAIEKMEKAGGKIVLPVIKEKSPAKKAEKEEPKEEKAVEKKEMPKKTEKVEKKKAVEKKK